MSGNGRDAGHDGSKFVISEIEHKYGNNVHIISEPCLFAQLARLCRTETKQPEINRIIAKLYARLAEIVVNAEFPKSPRRIETRLFASTDKAVVNADVLDPKTRVSIVSVARAGTMPSQVVFDMLCDLLDEEGVRLDSFFVSRATDDAQKVTGADVHSFKIGGDVAGRHFLLPDPMGATGSSVVNTLDVYRRLKLGEPAKKIMMHLIVTPEYIKKVLTHYPEAIIYALRLDRGMSDEETLKSVPGTFPDKERGLNDRQYIVPGAGGLGELMTNAFV